MKSITHSMKFLTALVIFIILSSILSGCNDQRTDQENTSGQISKEIDLKSLHQEDTVLIKTWSSGTYRDEYEYNDQGWPVKMLTYKIDDEGVEKLFQKYEVEYDGSGQQILMKYWDEDQNLAAWFECEYDSLGYFKIEKYKNANGSINQRYEYEYEYDEQGNVKTENCFRFKGNKKKGYMCHHFTYDPGNEIRLAEYYDKKGKVSKRIEYNQGEITKETEYDDQGNVVNCRELEFDSQGREVKKTETDKEKCKYEQSE